MEVLFTNFEKCSEEWGALVGDHRLETRHFSTTLFLRYLLAVILSFPGNMSHLLNKNTKIVGMRKKKKNREAINIVSR